MAKEKAALKIQPALQFSMERNKISSLMCFTLIFSGIFLFLKSLEYFQRQLWYISWHWANLLKCCKMTGEELHPLYFLILLSLCFFLLFLNPGYKKCRGNWSSKCIFTRLLEVKNWVNQIKMRNLLLYTGLTAVLLIVSLPINCNLVG